MESKVDMILSIESSPLDIHVEHGILDCSHVATIMDSKNTCPNLMHAKESDLSILNDYISIDTDQ